MFRSYYGSYRQLLLAIAALFIISGCSSDQDKPASNKSSTVSKSSSEGPICDSGDASTSDAPCIISTLKQLQAINDSKLSRAGHYALASDIDASATLKWTNDKGETQGFKPIEDFSGSFDGRGHTISHLYINHSGWGLAGLFAALSEASEISNLRFSDASINSTSPAGILAGRSGGLIRDVHVHGEVKGTDRSGGLVGTLNKGATISNSSSTGSINADGEQIGGLVGQNDGSINSSYSLMSVHGRSTVGGLVGRSEGSVKRSYSIVAYPEGPEEKRVTARTSSSAGLIAMIEDIAVIDESYAVSYAGKSRFDFRGKLLIGKAWGDAEYVTRSIMVATR